MLFCPFPPARVSWKLRGNHPFPKRDSGYPRGQENGADPGCGRRKNSCPGSLSRLAALYRAGIRVLTLLWGGNTCIGGSHDTDSGLTPFGRAVVRKCHQIGIIPDISHASVASAEEIIEISLSTGKPCIASHSDSYHVFPHTRNLSDRHFLAIRVWAAWSAVPLPRASREQFIRGSPCPR